jgi:hypothetical protein
MSKITPISEGQGASTKAADVDVARELSRAFDQFEASLTRKLGRRRRKRHVKPTARGAPPAGN